MPELPDVEGFRRVLADLLFADAAGWDRPIRFRGGVGGHASVHDVAADAGRLGVRRVVYAHIGRPCLRAIDAGLRPPDGEWGGPGRTNHLTVPEPTSASDTSRPSPHE